MRLIPYREEVWPALSRLQEEVNRLFEGALPGTVQAMEWQPRVDVVETPETLVVKAELPGVEPDDVDISVAGEQLTIKGEKKAEKEEKGKTWYRRERMAGFFTRTIPLPVAVDTEHIEAEQRGGVVTVTLPKRAEARARKIPVKAK